MREFNIQQNAMSLWRMIQREMAGKMRRKFQHVHREHKELENIEKKRLAHRQTSKPPETNDKRYILNSSFCFRCGGAMFCYAVVQEGSQ